jgi:hypothetical protein
MNAAKTQPTTHHLAAPRLEQPGAAFRPALVWGRSCWACANVNLLRRALKEPARGRTRHSHSCGGAAAAAAAPQHSTREQQGLEGHHAGWAQNTHTPINETDFRLRSFGIPNQSHTHPYAQTNSHTGASGVAGDPSHQSQKWRRDPLVARGNIVPQPPMYVA